MIPVIGTAIVNGVHWLERLIDSIDYPVENFIIFNNNGRDQITDELNSLVKKPHNFIQNLKICHLPSNIGVAAVWNLIIKSYINSPYWVICNHDVAFESGFLEEMVQASQKEEIGIVHGKGGEEEADAIDAQQAVDGDGLFLDFEFDRLSGFQRKDIVFYSGTMHK